MAISIEPTHADGTCILPDQSTAAAGRGRRSGARGRGIVSQVEGGAVELDRDTWVARDTARDYGARASTPEAGESIEWQRWRNR